MSKAKVIKLSVARISKQLREELEKTEVVEPRRLIFVQPTMSKTDRLLACAYPWNREVPAEDIVAQPARFGSAFHELMAHKVTLGGGIPSKATFKRLAKKWSVDGDVDAAELEERITRAAPVLSTFLCGGNPWGINFNTWRSEIETAYAFNVENGTARRIKLPDEKTHEYRDLRPYEFPGTVDRLHVGLYRTQNTVLVLDHKSGFLITAPEASGQLRSLSLAACRATDAHQALIAFLHAPGDGTTPTITCDELSATDLTQHSHALQDAFADIGNGTLRPGSHCKWCPATSICPAHTSALAEIRGSGAIIASPEAAGEAHQRLTALRSQFKQYDDMITAEIRAYVKQNGSCPRPDGSAVSLIERSYESLSKSSILDSLGPLKGAREIRRLEKLGCVKNNKRLELRKV